MPKPFVRALAGAHITPARTYDHRVARPDQTRVSPENRKLLVSRSSCSRIVIAFAASNVAANHEPEPHGLPVGVVGSPDATRAEPRTAILQRRVYGAFLPAPQPTLLVAGAAGQASKRRAIPRATS